MNKKAAKCLVFFLFAMLFFTFASWKLDGLRTHQVLCMNLMPGVVNGKAYDIVVPSEAVFYDGEGAYVYIVEDTKSVFYPLLARKSTVTILDSGDGKTAIQGLYRQSQMIRFTDRPPGSSTVPVVLWEETLLAGRVEVIPQEDLDAAEDILREAAVQQMQSWEISQEEDRLVVENVDKFTAQTVRSALAASGIESIVLDYTWSSAVMAQTGRLWLVWAAALGLWLLWSVLWLLGRREWGHAQDALEEQYLGTYLADAGVRLLAESIVLAASVILTVAALQWLWQVEIALPRDLLPEGSVFDLDHYRMWARNAFPDGYCSAYGADLAAELGRCGILAGVECVALTVAAVLLRTAIGLFMKRRG